MTDGPASSMFLLTRDEKLAIIKDAVQAGITKVVSNVVDDMLTGTPEANAAGILQKGMDRYFKVYEMATRIIVATEKSA